MKDSINTKVSGSKKIGFRILFLQTSYIDTDGSSISLNGFIKDNKDIINYKVLSLQVKGNTDINIRTITTWSQIKEEIDSNNYDIIHYFKTYGYTIFNWTYRALKFSKNKLPIYMTVNQNPSYKGLLLSPKEIRASEVIVFIDSAAYSNQLVSFIPKDRKEKIYYCISLNQRILNELYLKRSEKHSLLPSNSHVVFGRGSTESKCPIDIYDIFHKIEYPDKEFIVVGIPKESRMYLEGNSYKDITVYPILPKDEWYKKLAQFDVFLYQIPETSHSSLDGTLGAAMALGIPVVYYGSEAPKEFFIHGDNGFVASSKDEIPVYCKILAEEPNLRKKIGDTARQSYLAKFKWQETTQKYSNLWSKRFQTKIPVPFGYKLTFYKTSICKITAEYIYWSFLGGLIRKHIKTYKKHK